VRERTGVGERISPGVYLFKDAWLTAIVMVPDEMVPAVRDRRPACPRCGTIDAMGHDPFSRTSRCVCGHEMTAEDLSDQPPRWLSRETR